MIRTIEELTLNAWPGLQTVFYDGWILRFANGYTRRANSILPLFPSRIDPAEKINRCESLYWQHKLPVIFKLAGRSESDGLNQLLLDQEYQTEADTSVQVADIRAWKDGIAADVRLNTQPNQEWETAYQSISELRPDQQVNHRQILAAIVPPKCFATIQANGQTIGCALGVLQNGFIGIYDVLVHPSSRRRGFGERLMRSLMAWGQQEGANTAYLQVMLNNRPALRLYERLGFKEQYQYWYCVKAFKE